MAVSFDVATEFAYRVANIGSAGHTGMAFAIWARFISAGQNYSSVQSKTLLVAGHGSNGRAVYLGKDNNFGDGSINAPRFAVADSQTGLTAFASNPPFDTWFFCYLRCGDNAGTRTLFAEWSTDGSTWVSQSKVNGVESSVQAEFYAAGGGDAVTGISAIADVAYFEVFNSDPGQAAMRALFHKTASTLDEYAFYPLVDSSDTGDDSGNSRDLSFNGSVSTQTSPSNPPNGLVTATVDQFAFRWGNDDGDESSHTFAATQGTDLVADLGSYLLRVGLQADDDPASVAYTLRYQKNGSGGYVPVPVGATVPETPAQVVAVAAANEANPTTSFTITVPTVEVDDLLEVTFISRDHTSGTGHPTVSDNQSGSPGWSQAGFSDNRQVHVFYRRATSGVAGSTITVSGCVGSSCGALRVIRGALGSGNPFTDFVWEENASGNETHASFTPSNDNSFVTFIVANDTNDTLTVSSMAAATLGTFEPEDYNDLSSGGNDCAIYVSGRGQSGTATATGQFSWSQTNATTISGTYAIRPKASVSNEVYISTSANIAAGGENTTNRLTGGSGSFVTGRRWDNENGSDSIDITSDNYTELEWSLTTQSPAANNDFFDFQVYAGDNALDSYTDIPRWTIAVAQTVELEVDDALHAHSAGSPALVQANTLAVGNAAHGHLAGSPALVQANLLVVQGATHDHEAGSVVLTVEFALDVDDAGHAHAAGSPALIQANTLAAQGASHSHSAGSPTLSQSVNLAAANAAHSHTAGSPALTQANVLAAQSGTHAHTAGSPSLVQANTLAASNASHGHTADNLSLSTAGMLAVANAIHSHGVDNIALTQAHVLTLANALHTHAATNVVLSFTSILDVDGASHGHSAGEPELSFTAILAVGNTVHEHLADTIELTQAHTLVVSSALHAHLAGSVGIQVPGGTPPERRVFIVRAPNRTFVRAPNRTYVVTKGNRIFQA